MCLLLLLAIILFRRRLRRQPPIWPVCLLMAIRLNYSGHHSAPSLGRRSLHDPAVVARLPICSLPTLWFGDFWPLMNSAWSPTCRKCMIPRYFWTTNFGCKIAFHLEYARYPANFDNVLLNIIAFAGASRCITSSTVKCSKALVETDIWRMDTAVLIIKRYLSWYYFRLESVCINHSAISTLVTWGSIRQPATTMVDFTNKMTSRDAATKQMVMVNAVRRCALRQSNYTSSTCCFGMSQHADTESKRLAAGARRRTSRQVRDAREESDVTRSGDRKRRHVYTGGRRTGDLRQRTSVCIRRMSIILLTMEPMRYTSASWQFACAHSR